MPLADALIRLPGCTSASWQPYDVNKEGNMTNDLEIQPNLSGNDADDDDDNDEVSQLSLSPPPAEETQPTAHVSLELHEQVDELLHVDDDDDELTKFIKQARNEGFNCLDLSKKNITDFPPTLLEFPSLQYLYLEGNQIAHLPSNLFLRLPNLKWIDLRNNQLTEIPSDGLAKHGFLRYFLLGGNSIRTLPIELGKVKGLSALNLDGNPLEHPPVEILKHGIKAIQQYLRDEHIRRSKCAHEKLDTDDEQYDEERSIDMVADVWASSDDEQTGQRRLTRSETGFYESVPSNALPTHLQSCIHYKRVSYSEMRMHPPASARRRAKSDLKLPRVKTAKKVTPKVSNDPVGDAFAARAQQERQNNRLKHRKIKIDEELQKVKTQEFVYEWKEDYRSSQQQLRRKRLIKGKDYQEPIAQAPFGIDPNYIPVMNKDQQERVEKAVRQEARRTRSPESALREEEERRVRDRQVQDRIREITGKMLRRRTEARGNVLEEKRQAELELRELRKLETEVKQRRTQIDTRFKAYTGDVKSRKKF